MKNLIDDAAEIQAQKIEEKKKNITMIVVIVVAIVIIAVLFYIKNRNAKKS